MPKTIEMTPTWKASARILLECLKHGDSDEAKQGAEAEIIRMAELLDELAPTQHEEPCWSKDELKILQEWVDTDRFDAIFTTIDTHLGYALENHPELAEKIGEDNWVAWHVVVEREIGHD